MSENNHGIRPHLCPCFDVLRQQESMTITELTEVLCKPRPTVAGHVKQLVNLGLAFKIEYQAKSGLAFRYSVSPPVSGHLDIKLRICFEAVVMHGPSSAKELAKILGQPVTTIADYLKKLYSLGLLSKNPYRGHERTSYKYEVWLFSQ